MLKTIESNINIFKEQAKNELHYEKICDFKITFAKSNILKNQLLEKFKENINKIKENFVNKLKTFENKILNAMKTRISKITEIKSKMSDFIKTKNSKNNNFDFKKELYKEVNKFNDINNSLNNKISILELEKTKLFFQIQNYESVVKKNEKNIKSLSDSLIDNQNTIVKLNLKVEGLINENNNNKIFHKELNSIKEEFDRERGINFMLNKKV